MKKEDYKKGKKQPCKSSEMPDLTDSLSSKEDINIFTYLTRQKIK